MAISPRIGASIVFATAVAFALAGCTPISTPNDSSRGGHATGPSASFSGSESGKVTMNLCEDGGHDSILVVVDGSSRKLPGVVSRTDMNFDGADSTYQLDKTGPMPQFSTDGNTVTLDGVKLTSILKPGNLITLSGKITCP